MATSRTPVILGGPKDWEEWLEIIKTLSMRTDIWKFVDPSVSESQHQEPVKPVQPTPEAVRALTTLNTPNDSQNNS